MGSGEEICPSSETRAQFRGTRLSRRMVCSSVDLTRCAASVPPAALPHPILPLTRKQLLLPPLLLIGALSQRCCPRDWNSGYLAVPPPSPHPNKALRMGVGGGDKMWEQLQSQNLIVPNISQPWLGTSVNDHHPLSAQGIARAASGSISRANPNFPIFRTTSLPCHLRQISSTEAERRGVLIDTRTSAKLVERGM